jgi:DNA polymerase, archaea type
VKISFWLLDINPKIDEDTGTIELWLWGIDSTGNRVLVVDRHFTAYFYAVVNDGFDESNIVEAITAVYAQSIVKAEIAHRRLFGKPVTAIKIYCKVATETGKLANQLRSIEGVAVCLEEDVRASMRYLIDNNLEPCTW